MKVAINEIVDLTCETLVSVIDYFIRNRGDVALVRQQLGQLSITNGYGTEWYIPSNPILSQVSISVDDECLKGFSLWGKFDLTISDLIGLWGMYKSFYVPYDDEYNLVFVGPNKSYSVIIHDKLESPSSDTKVLWITVSF